jgi:hypothetical protein
MSLDHPSETCNPGGLYNLKDKRKNHFYIFIILSLLPFVKKLTNKNRLAEPTVLQGGSRKDILFRFQPR